MTSKNTMNSAQCITCSSSTIIDHILALFSDRVLQQGVMEDKSGRVKQNPQEWLHGEVAEKNKCPW